jgi:sugar phosphate permease
MNAIPYRYRVLAILCSLTTLTYLDRICISLVGVRVKAEFHLTNVEFGWVLAAFSLAYALFEIPTGILGDRIGPRKVFIRIVLWWSFFTALTGFSTGLISLILIRFLFGVGEAGTYPNAMTVMSRWFPRQEMGRALVGVGIGSQIGSAIAPLIIIPIAAAFGWRMPFFVNALIGIFWVAICFAWFRNFPSEMKNISSDEKNLIERNCRHEKQQRLINWKLILNNKNVWTLMLMYFCCQWANYFFVAWMPVYLQEGRHFSENEMKITATFIFIAGILATLAGGFAADFLVKRKGLKFGRRVVGITGLGGCGLVILLAAFTPDKTLAAILLIAGNAGFSFGVMVSYAVCTDIGRNNSGTVAGAMNFFGQMGAFSLALLFGKLADALHNFNYPLILVGLVMITGGLLWLGIDPERKLFIPSTEPERVQEKIH